MKGLALVRNVALAAGVAASTACSPSREVSSSDKDITSIENTDVKEQPIGNCWLYATAGWIESLHKVATAEDVNLSEAYWSYWYWYEQITGGDLREPAEKSIEEGGKWGHAVELIRRYGWMHEADLPMPEERAVQALAAINASLTSGALASSVSRRDPRIVRDELDKAWGFEPAIVVDLEQQFPVAAAQGSERTGRDAAERPAPPLPLKPISDRAPSVVPTRIHAPRELPVIAEDGASTITLADTIGTLKPETPPGAGKRVGAHAWSRIDYFFRSDDTARRRALLKNVQDALHRRLAVPIAWFHMAYLADAGSYRVKPGFENHTGGFHMSVVVDYEVENAPGFGKLPVAVRELRPAALEAALAEEATVSFFRIKNSWGTSPSWGREELEQAGVPADSTSAMKATYLPSKPGYNDLHLEYLDLSYGAPPLREISHFATDFVLPNELRFAIPLPKPAPELDGTSK